MEKRYKQIADRVVAHSLGLRPGHKVVLKVRGQADGLTECLIPRIYEAGAVPFLQQTRTEELKWLLSGASEEQIRLWAKHDLELIKEMDAYIGIHAEENIYEMEDVDSAKYSLYVKHYLQPLMMAMASKEQWTLLRYPTGGMAQQAGLGSDKLQNLYFRSCTMDYGRLKEQAEPLARLLERTESVRIVSPGTDLSFSVKNIPVFLCDGRYNLPDGELFTAPVAGSAEGRIRFNVPTSYMGRQFHSVSLEFREGRLADAACSDTAGLLEILNSDPGASRLGEFGIGFNPHLTVPINNLLFDEKMAGSIHLAFGQAYEMADNGNTSVIHLDLVLCQLEAYGGGKLYFDGVLVRKDGMFVLPELAPLNP
ncbi:aminopeptidase [Paenibacillus lutrae]|uniref:Aminopeptidase n=1 Tax=Paenibacillus lutrae TaxID=2078573 RepID=A0A7X3FFP9_9BACL|nr:aminopeptidase [Paenibacillus lutrae]MVO98873.1 aminopeptidase [Paenibacillus lutrae]